MRTGNLVISSLVSLLGSGLGRLRRGGLFLKGTNRQFYTKDGATGVNDVEHTRRNGGHPGRNPVDKIMLKVAGIFKG